MENHLWAVGGGAIGGTILQSADGGEHWNIQMVGDVPMSVWTNDGQSMWAVGQCGLIFKSTDGENWNKQVSGTLEDLYSIQGASDRRLLWVVGADGRILKSADGEHWIKQANGNGSRSGCRL
jgi:photosystem II stability/assembly factor-like uncharacterized protein